MTASIRLQRTPVSHFLSPTFNVQICHQMPSLSNPFQSVGLLSVPSRSAVLENFRQMSGKVRQEHRMIHQKFGSPSQAKYPWRKIIITEKSQKTPNLRQSTETQANHTTIRKTQSRRRIVRRVIDRSSSYPTIGLETVPGSLIRTHYVSSKVPIIKPTPLPESLIRKHFVSEFKPAPKKIKIKKHFVSSMGRIPFPKRLIRKQVSPPTEILARRRLTSPTESLIRKRRTSPTESLIRKHLTSPTKRLIRNTFLPPSMMIRKHFMAPKVSFRKHFMAPKVPVREHLNPPTLPVREHSVSPPVQVRKVVADKGYSHLDIPSSSLTSVTELLMEEGSPLII